MGLIQNDHINFPEKYAREWFLCMAIHPYLNIYGTIFYSMHWVLAALHVYCLLVQQKYPHHLAFATHIFISNLSLLCTPLVVQPSYALM